MSELNKQAHKTDANSTQTFILKKQRAPHPPDTLDYTHNSSQPYAKLKRRLLTCKKALVTFNSDGKHYTPAFIDPLEKVNPVV